MSRGGFRPNAGRPKGARDKAPRLRPAPEPEAEAQKAFLEACSDFVQSGEPYRILRQFLASTDDRMRAWAVEKLLLYGVGKPGEVPTSQTPGFNVEKLLEELARRRGLLKPELRALPAPREESET